MLIVSTVVPMVVLLYLIWIMVDMLVQKARYLKYGVKMETLKELMCRPRQHS